MIGNMKLQNTKFDFDFGSEDKILNAVWVGILGLEVLMVLGVAIQSIWKRLAHKQPNLHQAELAAQYHRKMLQS
ncbi:unnamed protein product [Clonostachys rhizophaga]|uniref:Uncharacterized protein n=1 Tax=Clonostachys rhizophaga TaxID=160324 RepID=A0A9N9V395_9HYPO|nr:unnamed protein product [Clonostachys rhizophaga]